MKSRISKYHGISDVHFPINGNMVHYHIKSNKIKKTDLARDLDILPGTLNKYFKKDSLQFGVLWRLSKTLNHNFLAQMSEFLQIPFETQAEKKLKAELDQKNELIKKMEIQLEILKEMNGRRQ